MNLTIYLDLDCRSVNQIMFFVTTEYSPSNAFEPIFGNCDMLRKTLASIINYFELPNLNWVDGIWRKAWEKKNTENPRMNEIGVRSHFFINSTALLNQCMLTIYFSSNWVYLSVLTWKRNNIRYKVTWMRSKAQQTSSLILNTYYYQSWFHFTYYIRFKHVIR